MELFIVLLFHRSSYCYWKFSNKPHEYFFKLSQHCSILLSLKLKEKPKATMSILCVSIFPSRLNKSDLKLYCFWEHVLNAPETFNFFMKESALDLNSRFLAGPHRNSSYFGLDDLRMVCLRHVPMCSFSRAVVQLYP